MLIVVKVVRAGAIAAAGFAFFCALVPTAGAVGVDDKELGRWVPSAGFVLGFVADRFEGHLNTSEVYGPRDMNPVPPNPEPVILPEAPATDRTVMIIPTFGGSFELMTPSLAFEGRPRLFGRVDIAYSYGPEYKTPGIGDPGPFSVSGSPSSGGVTEARILGQGGRTQVETAPLVVTAGGGIAFTVSAGDRALRIKPSVEYMRHDVEVSGIVRRAVQLRDFPLGDLTAFREIDLRAETSHVYHMIGPGIEFDFDAARAGDFVLAPYVSLKSYVVLDNTKTVVEATNEYGETAVFTYLPNRWAFGGSLGLRFRWAPE